MANTRKSRQKKTRTIQVNGRRWFHKGPGNTYYTASIAVNGKHVHTIPMDYGYGEMYLQSAGAWLAKNGYLPGIKEYATGGLEPLWSYCQRVGCVLQTDVADVGRRKDLHDGGK